MSSPFDKTPDLGATIHIIVLANYTFIRIGDFKHEVARRMSTAEVLLILREHVATELKRPSN